MDLIRIIFFYQNAFSNSLFYFKTKNPNKFSLETIFIKLLIKLGLKQYVTLSHLF